MHILICHQFFGYYIFSDIGFGLKYTGYPSGYPSNYSSKKDTKDTKKIHVISFGNVNIDQKQMLIVNVTPFIAYIDLNL